MSRAVKIRKLTPPPMPLEDFDPGAYLGSLEFYETEAAIGEEDRDGLAQIVHFLAFLAMKSQSSQWGTSVIPAGSDAARALEAHFGHLPGWPGIPAAGLSYRQLAGFLLPHYPPKKPKT